MKLDPSRLSVTELRERCHRNGFKPTRRLLARLRDDPRQGVRKLCARLIRQQQERRQERRRLRAMNRHERRLWKQGTARVAGLDEAGIGPLAGPVVAAAVIFEPGTVLAGIDDSKQLPAREREKLAAAIRARALAWGVGCAEVEEIDRLNVYWAGRLAMSRAVGGLGLSPQHLLIDGRRTLDLKMPQTAIVGGDRQSLSIAAASILAKTHRDALMLNLDRRYPHYGFARHKGYGTPEHRAALKRHGPTPVHRRSFPVLKELCGECSGLYYRLRQELQQVATAAQLALFEDELRASRPRLGDGEARRIRLEVTRRRKSLS